MSRRRVVLKDGRRVTGYRKTLAHKPRTPIELIPEWELRVDVPDQLAFSLSTGQTSVTGVSVEIPGPAIVGRGKNGEWVKRQVEHFLGVIAKDTTITTLQGVMSRPQHPGLTSGAPWKPAVKRVVRLKVQE